ncbi:hypothetical protein LTR36_001904 [Oleoguttula mirabilis]|uniref:NAD(P)-binding protein n=1 Tax=Oleoguttula mirabilis TaxID=1507867 RepID=A0AAV9JMX8_9PEZI|nr:hypothetical protein LTR36_001904 [Oleoguttula mirabilis]
MTQELSDGMAAFLQGTPKVDFSKPLNISVLKGKVALVTGAASGIGRGIAVALAENGASVALCDIDERSGHDVEKDLHAKGLTAKFIRTDTTSWDSQLSAFKETKAWFGGGLDIVVPAAGLPSHGLHAYILPTKDDADADPPKPPTRVLDVNLTGVYYSTTLALHSFNRQAATAPSDGHPAFRPQILFVASLKGYEAFDFDCDYSAAKFGVRAIWKSVRRPAADMAPYQANLLAPTWVRTPMIDEWLAMLEEKGVKVAEVADVVDAALRCICDEGVEDGVAGTGNFDVWDDLAGSNGTKELLEKLAEGRLGKLF